MISSGRLADLLGLHNKEIAKIEKKLGELTKLVRENNNDIDEYEEIIQIITKSINNLMKDYYDSLRSINYEKRKQFFNFVNDTLNQLRRELRDVLPGRVLCELDNELETLKLLCNTNFDETPLDFCRRRNKYMNRWCNYEKQVMDLIEKICEEEGLQNILDEQLNSIRNSRKKIVLTVLGSLKSTKSSFINFLLEEDVCPTGNQAATARLTKITYGEEIKLTQLTSTGDVVRSFNFDNTKELLSKATELIKLLPDERSAECNNEILIELPNEALKNVELWDIPGFDENDTLDNRVKDIVDDADLIFALIPHKDSLKKSFQNFIKPQLNEHHGDPTDYMLNMSMGTNCQAAMICFIIAQIDTFTIDNQTNESRDVVLANLYKILETQLNFKFNNSDMHLCNNFIPICTHYRFDIKAFSESRQMFIDKSKQWFENAVKSMEYYRVKYLAHALEQILEYGDASRAARRCEELKQDMVQIHAKFESKLSDSISELLEPIRKHVQDNKDDIVEQCRLLIKQQDGQKLKDAINKIIIKKFQQALNQKEKYIHQESLKILQEHANSLEHDPALTQLCENIILETYLNPYRLGMRFYKTAYKLGHPVDIFESGSPISVILGSSMFWGLIILSSINPISAACSFVGFLMSYAHFFYKFGTQPPDTITDCSKIRINSKLEAELTKWIDATHNDLVQQMTNAIRTVSEQHFEGIKTKIDEKIKKLNSFSKHAGKLEQVTKEAKLRIGELYLDLLSEQFKITIPVREIHRNEQLGSSNFQVFAAELQMQNLKRVEAAAKQIPLAEFNIQEVRYLTLLRHPNIIRFYGISKSHKKQVYYIIMDRMNCNAYTYFEQNSGQKSDTQAIKMFSEITNALHYIHQKDLVHRDIKPANILVKMDAANVPSFYLADFGFVHREPITRCGTCGYVAPECVTKGSGPITHKSDVYSWGITIQKIIELVSSCARNTPELIKWKEASEKCVEYQASDRPNTTQILEVVK